MLSGDGDELSHDDHRTKIERECRVVMAMSYLMMITQQRLKDNVE